MIWNEVNRAEFWWPQKDAPAKYEALLGRCHDLLHAALPSVNVISSTSARGDSRGTDAAVFIRALGLAYRASQRTAPIVDAFGHNPYPAYSAEKPSARHPTGGSPACRSGGGFRDGHRATVGANARSRTNLP